MITKKIKLAAMPDFTDVFGKMQRYCIFIFDNIQKNSQFVNAFINQNLVIIRTR